MTFRRRSPGGRVWRSDCGDYSVVVVHLTTGVRYWAVRRPEYLDVGGRDGHDSLDLAVEACRLDRAERATDALVS